jgi:hypothetical protein
MILSHKYKFIFIKTNKTAGTSIEIALSKFCDPSDIITPIAAEDSALRDSLGYRGAQNYLGENGIKFHNHMSAKEIKQKVGDKIWNEYYKFCFERNPWDRLISMYYWRCQSEPRPSVSEFLSSDVPLLLKLRGYELYTDNGQIIVDKVCRFENISEELEMIRIHLGLPEQLELPSAKSKYRKDKRSYREILSSTEKMQIEKLFSDEIKLFNYNY